MKKEDMKKAFENGEISIDAILDTLVIETRRASALYDLVNRLEKLIALQNSNISNMAELSRDNERILEFAKLVFAGEGEWKAILQYIYDDVYQKSNPSTYIDVNEILYVDAPTNRESYLKFRSEIK